MGKKKDRKKKAPSATEMERRRAQAAAATGQIEKKDLTPQELIRKFSADIINLSQHKTGLKAMLNSRIKMAEQLMEREPMKFNVLRVDTLKQLRDEFQPIDEGVKTLMVISGTLEDLPTFAEKMAYMSDNMDKLIDAATSFDEIARNFQVIDAQFNQQLASIVRPAAVASPNGPTVMQSTVGDDAFKVNYQSSIADAPGVEIPLVLQFDGTDNETLHKVAISAMGTKILFNGEPMNTAQQPTIIFDGNISQLNNFFTDNYSIVVGDQPSGLVIEIEGMDQLMCHVNPIIPERMEDTSMEVSAEDAQAIMEGIKDESISGTTDPEQVKAEHAAADAAAEEALKDVKKDVEEQAAQAAKIMNFQPAT